MKKSILFLFLVLSIVMFTGTLKAQSAPVLYFCERYDDDDGEIGITDRFSTGYLTVVVKSDYQLELRDVHIQFDRYDQNSRRFKFYKKFDYTIEPEMNYVYFSKTESNDMSFDEPGFYRVFLLNKADETIASAIIQIVE